MGCVVWDKEACASVKTMIAEGRTYDEVAQVHGSTAAAVGGLVRRKGYARKATHEERSFICRRAGKTKPAPEPVEPNGAVLEAEEIFTNLAIEAALRKASPDKLKSIADNEGCRFIIGDPRIDRDCACGRQMVPGRFYCAEHLARTTAPLRKQARKIPPAPKVPFEGQFCLIEDRPITMETAQ